MRFAHTEPAQSIQEIATVIRFMTEIGQLSVDTTQRSLALRGTSGQIALAEWLFDELDRPRDQERVGRKYRMPGGGDDSVRVFYVTHADTPQRLQEIAVHVRSKAGVRRLFIYNAPKAMALRGTVDQMAQAERLIKEWDR